MPGGLTSPIPILAAINKESGLETCNEAELIRLKWISNEVRTRNLATETCESLACVPGIPTGYKRTTVHPKPPNKCYLKVFPQSHHPNCNISTVQFSGNRAGSSTPARLQLTSRPAHSLSPSHSTQRYHSAIRCRRTVNGFTTTKIIIAISKEKESAYSINCCILIKFHRDHLQKQK